MKLQQIVELIHRSSTRMMSLLDEDKRDDFWWQVLRREAWLHLRRTLKLLYLVLQKKV